MHYEINVARNGQHFFATAERSITTRAKLLEVFDEMKRAFPAAKGYTLSVSEQQTVGRQLDINAL